MKTLTANDINFLKLEGIDFEVANEKPNTFFVSPYGGAYKLVNGKYQEIENSDNVSTIPQLHTFLCNRLF